MKSNTEEERAKARAQTEHAETERDINRPRAKLRGRPLIEFLDLEIDPKTNLVGKRYLTHGSGAFVISPSGHGKSSFAIQLAISFAVGRVAFGMKPDRPLRILLIQSEDDEAEVKKFAQMIRRMKLTQREQELLRKNLWHERRRDISNQGFVDALDDFLEEFPADIVIINPLTGFVIPRAGDDEFFGNFLREKLDPILDRHHCGAFVIHHTPKMNYVKFEKMEWYEWMYAMTGRASLTNWARAVLVIAPSKVPGVYRFIAAKRFNEIQWTEREYWFAHFTESMTINGEEVEILQWVAATEDQIAAAKPPPKGKKERDAITAKIVWAKMSMTDSYTRNQFQEWAGREFGIGFNRAWEILKSLTQDELVQVLEERRPKTNPLKWYRKLSESASAKEKETA